MTFNYTLIKTRENTYKYFLEITREMHVSAKEKTGEPISLEYKGVKHKINEFIGEHETKTACKMEMVAKLKSHGFTGTLHMEQYIDYIAQDLAYKSRELKSNEKVCPITGTAYSVPKREYSLCE